MAITQFVSFSGGKDSTALALLCPDAVPIFADTGWEFPVIYDHIAKFEQVTGREVVRVANDETLPEYIERAKFLPGIQARFCTRMFKIEPINRFLTDHAPAELLIALRADESARVGNQSEIEGITVRYPLQEYGYGLQDVIRICLDYALLPRYPVYMARGGCKGCFFKRRAEVKAMAQLVPDVLDELRQLEENVQDERGKYFKMFPNTDCSIRQIQQQPALFDMEDTYKDAGIFEGQTTCGVFCHK
jgi:hypothetical protein